MKENTLLSYDMYEELKSELIKALKAELSKMQGGDNTALMLKIEEIIKASVFSSEQITALINRIGQIDFKPTIKTSPPDNSGIKTLFQFIHGYLEQIEKNGKQTNLEVKSLREEVAQIKTEVDLIEIPKVLPPRTTHHRLSVSIESKSIFYLLVGMTSLIALLFCALYFETRPDYDRIDNDLKYRYIKMKGEATPERISELEDLFEVNRDNSKIRQLRKDVEEYEQAVQECARIEEQNRLRELEVERLNQQVKSIKSK